MRTALIHDWVVTLGGAERVLAALHDLLPDATLHTLFARDESLTALGFDPAGVKRSPLQRLPGIERRYRALLPLFPLAIESLDLSEYDLIVSASHCVAKGVLTTAEQRHVCYCFTPVRYAWDMTHSYLSEHRLGWGPKGLIARLGLHYMRQWDASTAPRVDQFIAISEYTKRRIRRTYGREASVVYPPVDVERFADSRERGDYFLFASRLVPYKHGPLIVEAFAKLGLPLVVVGEGPELERCRALAKRTGTITIAGHVGDAELADLMGRARAFVFAAEEDFGIVPVEAQAAGTPVIAYGKGGASETVIGADGHNWDRASGVHFDAQTAESLADAVRRFVAWEPCFRAKVIRANAARFGRARFDKEMRAALEEKHHPMSAADREISTHFSSVEL